MKMPRRYQALRLGCGEGLVSRVITVSTPVRRPQAAGPSHDRPKAPRGRR